MSLRDFENWQPKVVDLEEDKEDVVDLGEWWIFGLSTEGLLQDGVGVGGSVGKGGDDDTATRTKKKQTNNMRKILEKKKNRFYAK